MEFTLSFIKVFSVILLHAAPLLLSLAAVIILLGQIAGRLEGWSRFDAFYWCWITATTVGYGDIRPGRKNTRVLAIVIAFFGLMVTGIIVAIAVFAATEAFSAQVDLSTLKSELGLTGGK